jgi:hypothetical protein
MPCYCDIPNETDQIEIERRCKQRMYFDAATLLTNDQIDLCNKKNISAFPLPDVNTALCRLCSVLTQEQMEKVSAYYFGIKWRYKNLHGWYEQHCIDDTLHNTVRT